MADYVQPYFWNCVCMFLHVNFYARDLALCCLSYNQLFEEENKESHIIVYPGDSSEVQTVVWDDDDNDDEY